MNNTKNWFQLRAMYEYIRKQAEKQKFFKYIEIGDTFALVAVFLFFAIMPTITTISSLLGEIKSKETLIKKADSKIKNIIKAQETFAQVQEKYSLVEESFPSQPKYYIGTANLGTIFRDSTLDINQINISLNNSDKKNDSFFNSYEININGEGQYPVVMEMIKKILNNRRLINISGIQINQIKSEDNIGDPQKIKVNISNDLYFLPDNK